MMTAKNHWENIYSTKAPDSVSWFQRRPEMSLDLIRAAGLGKDDPILDAGGGASTLVDALLDEGYANITVLDIAAAALHVSQKRLGKRAGKVRWLEADIVAADFPADSIALWHDRALFHFLRDAATRKRYVETALKAIRPGGQAIIAAFGPEGPMKCSGLDIVRYSSDDLQSELGQAFRLEESRTELHQTPFETVQQFIYCRFRKTV